MTRPSADANGRRYPDLRLSPQHEALLAASAIAPGVAAARGYRTADTKAALEPLGFSAAQRRVPALLIPVCAAATRKVAFHQARPDMPRMNGKGKPIKYETPAGSRMVLDAHPAVHDRLGDPAVPLWITEGIRKADSAISRGACCVALLGVWNWRGRNKQGGLAALLDWEVVALNGRTVYLAFDSDLVAKHEVAAALTRFARFLTARGAHVAVVRLPQGEGGAKVGLDDYLAAGHTLGDAAALASAEIATAAVTNDRTGLPSIMVGNRPLRDMSADALRILADANDPPRVFARAGGLARIRHDERGVPVIEVLGEPHLRGRLARVANFLGPTREGGEQHVAPPKVVVQDLLALGTWPLPSLDAIVEAPVLRTDGSVLSTPGYDVATRLVYEPMDGLSVPPISAAPSASDIRQAVAIIDEAVGDFPYVDAASLANSIGLMLTPTVRPSIPGPVPLGLLDKPAAGTGASLLAEINALIATGRPAAMWGAPVKEEEWAKAITATLLDGATMVTIDNVDRPLASGHLSRALTSTIWKERILGRTENALVPQRATWAATGNNIKLRGDIARRCYWVRMNAGVAQPWRRPADIFRHPNLVEWVRAHRGDILAALLTLARAWFAAGQPRADVPRLGGFESWTHTVGGILSFAGIRGFLGNLDSLYELVDEESPQWSAFLGQWRRAFGEEPVTVATLLARLETDQDLREAVPDDLADTPKDKSASKRWGKALARHVDTVYGTGPDAVALVRAHADTHAKVVRWRVLCGVCGVSRVSPLPVPVRHDNNDTNNTDRKRATTNPPNPANPAPDIVAYACRVFDGEVVDVRPARSGGPHHA